MQILGGVDPGVSVPQNAPTSLSAVPTTTDVAISFTAPTNDGGSPITNYEYSFNNSTWTALSPIDATSPITVSGLTANTAYSVYLRAVNIVGAGPASSATSFTTNKVAPSTVEYLVVAGGGGGTAGNTGITNGGGGAGSGGSKSTSYSVTAGTPITVTVGGGGTAGNNYIGPLGGGTGVTSTFGVSVTGGSGGAQTNSVAGGSGATYTGGAGAAQNSSGGAGWSDSITGSSIQRGGGGGGGGAVPGTGGAGGGGNGTAGTSGGSGTPNTGGGGGGTQAVSNATAGAGGSGVVVVAYSQDFLAAAATTGSPTYSSVSRSGFHVYTFTGSGSITF